MKKTKISALLTVFLLTAVCITAQEKVLVCTHSYNRPDFIRIQNETFKTFLHDDYEFVVFNDAPEVSTENEIESVCKELGIRHVRIPQSIHSLPYLFRVPGENYQHPCIRCANVVQYSLDTLGFQHDGIFAIVDSDMFLVKDFSISNFMKDLDLVGVGQSRNKNGVFVKYIWNGLVFLNMKSLPDKEMINFNCGIVEGVGCDVGGYTHYYLQNHSKLKTKFIHASVVHSSWLDYEEIREDPAIVMLIEKNMNNVEFLIDFTFFHYRGGGNWDAKTPEYHKTKTEILNQFIKMKTESKNHI